MLLLAVTANGLWLGTCYCDENLHTFSGGLVRFIYLDGATNPANNTGLSLKAPSLKVLEIVLF